MAIDQYCLTTVVRAMPNTNLLRSRKAVTLVLHTDRRLLFISLASFVGIAIVLSFVFSYFEAFEKFYAFSRRREYANLDDVLMALVATMIGWSSALIVLVYTLGQRLEKTVEEKLDAERQLAHGHQLIALGTMLGGIAHSINNQLQPIITLTEMVKSDLPADSEQREDLDRVQRSARAAANMVSQLKAFARHDAGFIEHCQVGPAVQKAVELAQTVVPSTVQFSTDIQPIEREVEVSCVGLEIVLVNLINNAIDAIDGQQGHIHITLRTCDPPAHRLVGAKIVSDQTAWVLLSVEDSGKGMTDEEQRRMFQPFYTTKVVGKGTGLGLSETYGLVHKAGGAFDVTTALGRGTVVTVYLPLKTLSDGPVSPLEANSPSSNAITKDLKENA